MMKTITLLMAIVASMLIHSTQAKTCFMHYTRAGACSSGRDTFTGTVVGTETKDYNFPLFYSKAAASWSCFEKNPAKGRFSGKLPITTNEGTMTFDFFTGKDQIKINFNEATGKGTITGGKGCYAGIKGTATRRDITNMNTPVANVITHYYRWKFCPTTPPQCTPQ
jgi:hypothetical protein